MPLVQHLPYTTVVMRFKSQDQPALSPAGDAGGAAAAPPRSWRHQAAAGARPRRRASPTRIPAPAAQLAHNTGCICSTTALPPPQVSLHGEPNTQLSFGMRIQLL